MRIPPLGRRRWVDFADSIEGLLTMRTSINALFTLDWLVAPRTLIAAENAQSLAHRGSSHLCTTSMIAVIILSSNMGDVNKIGDPGFEPGISDSRSQRRQVPVVQWIEREIPDLEVERSNRSGDILIF